jgi:cytochrome b subunit of formate dehydrogenase
MRFNLFQRSMHALVIVTFLGLVGTGMPLRFNATGWAQQAAQALGGFESILFFHKLFAVTFTAGFVTHIGFVLWIGLVQRRPGVFWGPTSMTPQPQDLRDMVQHFRWFLGRGARPEFGRFTYWEKFDYLAVFWGMFIIGTTGYVMWFSEAAARLLPGWAFNLALLIHADEALLATWFIFAIHFFNSHLRPEKFPMDLVIFTGRESMKDLVGDRAVEHRRLVSDGLLDDVATAAPERWLRNLGRIVGSAAIAIGFVLFGVTLYSFATEKEPSESVTQPDRAGIEAPVGEQLEPPDPLATTPPIPPTWTAAVGSVITETCATQCHDSSAIAGLDLRSYDSVLAGSSRGPVIVPGNAAASPLVTVQQAGGHPAQLTAQEIELLISWIDDGARES